MALILKTRQAASQLLIADKNNAVARVDVLPDGKVLLLSRDTVVIQNAGGWLFAWHNRRLETLPVPDGYTMVKGANGVVVGRNSRGFGWMCKFDHYDIFRFTEVGPLAPIWWIEFEENFSVLLVKDETAVNIRVKRFNLFGDWFKLQVNKETELTNYTLVKFSIGQTSKSTAVPMTLKVNIKKYDHSIKADALIKNKLDLAGSKKNIENVRLNDLISLEQSVTNVKIEQPEPAALTLKPAIRKLERGPSNSSRGYTVTFGPLVDRRRDITIKFDTGEEGVLQRFAAMNSTLWAEIDFNDRSLSI